jgi:hypothetical protein
MKSAGTTVEDRIRERAYYIWEADGCPTGRDEFWHRAREMITTKGERPKLRARIRQRKQSDAARLAHRQCRQSESKSSSVPASSRMRIDKPSRQ